MSWSQRVGRFSLIALVGGVAVGLCFAALIPGLARLGGSSQYSGEVAPRLRELDQRTVVYDINGGVLDVLGLQDREPAKLSEMPTHLINAVIATEDRTFYENQGVDLRAMIRAFWANVDAGDVEQGGSTITQQLVKQRYFKNPERDLDRKVKEAVLAWRLNDEWSKNRILEEYLNTVYFGNGAYGVRAAAERFFQGKRLEELDTSEAALLAGVIQNPEGNNPFTNPQGALERRGEVLTNMAQEGYLSADEALVFQTAPLPTVRPPADLRPNTYYVDEVQRRLLADPRLGATEVERANRLFKGGLRIYTAFDARYQFIGQSAISSTLPPSPFTAAIAAIDPANGDVKAMAGGLTFEQSQVNLATGAGGTGRQPGSTFKAIVLAAAFENGYSPNDTIDGTSPCTLRIPGYRGEPLRTANAEGGGGSMSIRSATSGSVNCAFFRLGAAVGIDKVVEMAKRLGVTYPLNLYYINSIGSGDGVSPLDMATVFATLAAEGVRHDPVFVRKVTDAEGNVIFEEQGAGVRAIDPEVARTVTEMLQGVVSGGTGTRAQLPGRQVAGKTGTTDEKSDAWFAGYTPQLAAAVWMGHPEGRVPMRNVGQFGSVFGGTYPAIIWQKFMASALEGQPTVGFTPANRSLWARGQYVTEAGRGRSTSRSSSSGSRTTTPTTQPPSAAPAPAATAPPATPPPTVPATTAAP